MLCWMFGYGLGELKLGINAYYKCNMSLLDQDSDRLILGRIATSPDHFSSSKTKAVLEKLTHVGYLGKVPYFL